MVTWRRRLRLSHYHVTINQSLRARIITNITIPVMASDVFTKRSSRVIMTRALFLSQELQVIPYLLTQVPHSRQKTAIMTHMERAALLVFMVLGGTAHVTAPT